MAPSVISPLAAWVVFWIVLTLAVGAVIQFLRAWYSHRMYLRMHSHRLPDGHGKHYG